MGGAIAEGNVTPAAEFNIWCDPEAAARVFASGIDMTMIGLDVTHKALFTQAHIGRLAGRVGEMVTELLRFYDTFHRSVYNFDGSPIHDALAVAHVVNPELVGTLKRNVEIDTESELCRGRTVVDLWQRTDRDRTRWSVSRSTRTGSSSCSSSGSTRCSEPRLRRDCAARDTPRGAVPGADKTHEALAELGRRFDAAAPEATIVMTPHNVHVEGHFAVVWRGRSRARWRSSTPRK